MKTLFWNGKVYVDKGIYAEAVLTEGNRIAAVGRCEEVLAAAEAGGGDFEKIDCEGRTIIPGLNDTHLHLMLLGLQLNEVKITGVKSIDELVRVCRAFMETYPERVKDGMVAMGWNQDLFTEGEKRMPNRHDLDRISTEIPIVLDRVCAHAAVANTKAIEILGLTADSPEIPGGEIRREADGYPSGIFTENATTLAKSAVPKASDEMKREALRAASEYAASLGLTTVQSNDIGASWCGDACFDLFREVYDAGEGKVRFHHQMSFKTPEDFEAYLTAGEFTKPGYERDSMLTLGPLKLFKDGSLGARTALMKNGYVGDRENHGMNCTSKEEMDRFCQLAKQYGVQVATHAIGDLAASEVMDCYEKAFVDGKNKLRHSLVHCQITDQEILDRIVEKDILVQAQPIFIDYDRNIVEPLCGQSLAETSYNFGTLLKRGAHLSYGTDCPVESCNPFPNIYMAVTRKGADGKPEGGFYPQQCVDVETAIDAYTCESAYCEFKEDIKGRIKPGYLADLVVLDRDIFTCDPMEIKDILPVMTMVDGKIVYRR